MCARFTHVSKWNTLTLLCSGTVNVYYTNAAHLQTHDNPSDKYKKNNHVDHINAIAESVGIYIANFKGYYFICAK